MDATPRYSSTAILAAALRLTSAVPVVLTIAAGVPRLQESTVTALLIMTAGALAALLQLVAAEVLLLLREIAAAPRNAAASASSLSPDEFETVIANALRETAPNPADPAKLPFDPASPAVTGRRVVCSQCGKKIRVPERSKYKPGDTARCPSCRERIVV